MVLINTDNMALNIDSENFKKLAVAAYATARKSSDLVYQNILIIKKGSYIHAYGTDYYQSYHTRIKCDKTNNAPDGLRLCLCADAIMGIAKNLKPHKNVIISHIKDTDTASIIVEETHGAEKFFEHIYTADVYDESTREFQDSKLDELCNVLNDDDIDPIKSFDLVKLEKMSKAIKTAITSAKDREKMTIEITRSGRNKQEIFSYDGWFDGVLMPIK